MERKQMIKQIRDEEGSGLVLTLLVLLVLSVLGTSLGMATIGSYRISDANRDDTSAYYIAEAGANWAYNDIKENILDMYIDSENMGELINKVTVKINDINENQIPNSLFESQYNSMPKAIIRIEGPFKPNEFIIFSKGIVNGKERIVEKGFSLKWKDKNNGGNLPKIPKDLALISKGKINLIAGGILEGTAYIDSLNNKSVTVSGGQGGDKVTILHPQNIASEDVINFTQGGVFKPKVIPKNESIHWVEYNKLLQQVTIPEVKTRLSDEIITNKKGQSYKVRDNGNLLLNSWVFDSYILDLQSDVYVPKIDIIAGKTLSINPQGGNHTMIVDDLSIQSGNLDIVGKGSVTIVVKKSISFNQTSKINESGKSNQLLLITNISSPSFNQISLMNANVIALAKNSSISIYNATINGIFLTNSKKVEFTGGNGNGGATSNMLLIAPEAEVILGKGYKIDGMIIGDIVTLTGGGKLTYKEIDTTGFLGREPQEGNENTPEEIIQHSHIIETKQKGE